MTANTKEMMVSGIVMTRPGMRILVKESISKFIISADIDALFLMRKKFRVLNQYNSIIKIFKHQIPIDNTLPCLKGITKRTLKTRAIPCFLGSSLLYK
jgi:hypothetical protein